MERVPVEVRGPALLRRGIESVVLGFAGVRLLMQDAPLPAETPAVALLVGSEWEKELERLQAGLDARWRLVVLIHGNEADAARALRLGVQQLVPADAPAEALEQALLAAAGTRTFSPPSLDGAPVTFSLPGSSARQAPATPWAALSTREQEVAGLAVDGLTNEQIATQLYLSLPTVKTHMRRILEKLRIERRTQLHPFLPARAPLTHVPG